MLSVAHPRRYLLSAKSYSGLHTRRFNPTTNKLIRPTPKTIRGQSPLLVASAIYAPSPSARSVVLPHETSSATMLAFQAPPDAVMAPVTHDPKTPGPISACHARTRRRPILAA